MAAPVGLFSPFTLMATRAAANDVFFLDQNTGVVSGTVFDGRGAIARTTDAGVSWSTLFFDQAIQGIDFPQPTSGFAVGAGGRISHSTDAGITWTDQTSGTSANLNDVSFASDALTRHRSWRRRHDSLDSKRRRTGADTIRLLQQLVRHPVLHQL